MGLLDGDLAALFHSALAGIYEAATLVRRTQQNLSGGSVAIVESPAESIRIQFDVPTEAMRAADGYVDTDVVIRVLAHGVAPFDTDAEIVSAANRWHILSVTLDTARSHYDCRCRRKAVASAG